MLSCRAFFTGRLRAKAIGPGEAVFLPPSTTPLSPPMSTTSTAEDLIPPVPAPSQRDARPRGVPDRAVLPLQPFLDRLVVDTPIARALDGRGQRGSGQRNNLRQAELQRPVDAAVYHELPRLRVDFGCWKVAANKELRRGREPVSNAGELALQVERRLLGPPFPGNCLVSSIPGLRFIYRLSTDCAEPRRCYYRL